VNYISQVCFKFRVNAEVESICKINSDALLLSLLLWGSRREFFSFCMLFYLQLRITKIRINIWPNDKDINQNTGEFWVSSSSGTHSLFRA